MPRGATKVQINYQTPWIHEILGKENALYFEANTPIEEIIKKVETTHKSFYPNTEINYQKSQVRFTRLYRNILPTFKGWRVLYRDPTSKDQSYRSISEKIGYKSRSKSDNLLKYSRTMLWKHQLFPAVEVVKIQPITNGAEIARRLNKQIKKSSLQPLVSNWLLHSENLHLYCQKLAKENLRLGQLKKDQQSNLRHYFDQLNWLYQNSKWINNTYDKNHFDLMVDTINVNLFLKEKKNFKENHERLVGRIYR